MSGIDWSKSPEGATHYSKGEPGKECPAFWREQGGRLVEFWGIYKEGEITHATNPAGYAKTPAECIPRPSSPSWSGPQDGLAPVGVTCWVHPHNTLWGFSSTAGHKRKILAYHTDFVWLGDDVRALEMTRIDKVDFSPIRTPEQIAADLANQAIKKIAVIICRDGAFDIDDPEVMESAVALYDHGLRFTVEQPK